MTSNPIRAIALAGLIVAALASPALAGRAWAGEAPASSSGPVKPRPGYVVFFEQGSADISPAAADIISLAAKDARRHKATILRIVGRSDHTRAVKAALEGQGVPAQSIVLVGPEEGNPVVRASTGIPEPINRRVLIAF